MSLRVRVLTATSEMIGLAPSWNVLLGKCDNASVFSTPAFCLSWWKAFGAGRSLRLVVVEDSANVRLIAPFIHEDSEPGTLRLIGYQYADYSDVVVAPGDSESVNHFLSWLFREPSWSKAVIIGLPKESPLLCRYGSAPPITASFKQRLLSSLDMRRPPVFAGVAPGHLCADFKDIQGCKNILQKEHYRRRANWFKERGKLDHQVFTEKQSCRELLPAFFAQHLSQWSGYVDEDPNAEAGMSFADAESREFFYNLVDELCPQSGVQMDVLSLDSRPIAMHFGLKFRGKMSSYKQSYDMEITHSPGKLLLGYILKDAAENGIQQIDGLGSYANMASRRNPVSSLVMYRTNRDAIFHELKGVPEKLRRQKVIRSQADSVAATDAELAS